MHNANNYVNTFSIAVKVRNLCFSRKSNPIKIEKKLGLGVKVELKQNY
jgi:hypothetical protein